MSADPRSAVLVFASQARAIAGVDQNVGIYENPATHTDPRAASFALPEWNLDQTLNPRSLPFPCTEIASG